MLQNIIISIFSLALAMAAGLISLGAVTKSKAPDVAIELQPMNGFAAENIVARIVRVSVGANGGTFPDSISPAALRSAKQAFLSEPVTPVAVAALALNAKKASERPLMQKAFALSRREPLVTGWMVADSSVRGDTPDILNFYDITLRTNVSAAPVLIPVMVNALSNRESLEPFANLLSRNPPWAAEFWEKLAEPSGSLINGAMLRKRLYHENENKEQYRDLNLVRSLLYAQHFRSAEELYTLLSEKSSKGSLVRNSSFDYAPEFPPLDWELVSTGEYGAAIADGRLQLSAIQNSGGVFAKQLVKLPTALIQIGLETSNQIPDDAEIVIDLACAEKMEIMPQPIRIKVDQQSMFRHINNKRSGCKYYWLELEGRASENGDGFDVGIESISMQAD